MALTKIIGEGVGSVDTITADNLTVDTTTLHVDSTNNRVGVGTVSPSNTVHVYTTNNAILRLEETNGYLALQQSGVNSYINNTASGGQLVFRNGASQTERMRIDGSGNLLVGKSAANIASVGFEAKSDGANFMTRDSGEPLKINRKTSNGNLLAFAKDGSTVGSIAVNGTSEVICVIADDTGIGLNKVVDGVYPIGSNLGARDNAVDLGLATARWKDLYLSSGLSIKGSDPKITLEHSNENGTAKIYTTAQSAIVLDADPDNTDNGTPIVFKVDGSEVGRFDDGGNFMVGTVNTVAGINNTGEGISLRTSSTSSSSIVVSRDAGISGYFNRNSDGDILSFRKDGSAVGSIGVRGGDSTYIESTASSRTGLDFAGGILPRYNGALSNGSTSLGAASYRFSDLYLSGGVYLGGTGSANKLDDYEEGTWTPQIFSNTTQISCTSISGFYTVIGNQVYVYGGASRNDTASLTGSLFIKNLPFTSDSSNRNYSLTGGVWFDKSSATDIVGLSWVSNGIAQINVKSMNGTGGDTYVSADNFENGRPVYFSATYRIA